MMPPVIAPRHPIPAILGVLLLLGGCAANPGWERGGYPSLAKRAVEGQLIPVESAEPVAPKSFPPAPALADRMRQLGGRADSGEAAFRRELATAQALTRAANGAAAASESWAVAQQAISRLDAARAATVVALVDIDALRAARIDAGQIDGEAELAALQQRIGAMAATQMAIIGQLSGSLRRP